MTESGKTQTNETTTSFETEPENEQTNEPTLVGFVHHRESRHHRRIPTNTTPHGVSMEPDIIQSTRLSRSMADLSKKTRNLFLIIKEIKIKKSSLLRRGESTRCNQGFK